MARSKTPEEIKQALLIQQAQMAEEEAKQKALAAQAEEAAKKQRIQGDDSDVEPQETQVKPLQTLHWKKITDAFKSQFGIDPLQDGTLVFPDRKSATEFFEKQAALGLKFFCALLPAKKEFEFSCGDGQLYSGGLSEIQAKLKTALTNASSENKGMIEEGLLEIQTYMKTNATQDARQAMQNLARPAGQDEVEENQSPSPLSTTNKPR